MKSPAALLLTVCCLSLLAPQADGQWNVAAPNLVRMLPVEIGAIAFKEGNLWAGSFTLFESRDSGVTWQQNIAFPLQTDDRILDIDLFDSAHILVTGSQGIYLSKDGGATWRILLNNTQIIDCASGCFCGSADTLALIDFSGTAWRSTNGGSSWSSKNLNVVAQKITYRRGALYAVTGIGIPPAIPFVGGTLFKSTDGGGTWQSLSGIFDQDCYAIGFDSCHGSIYITNEGYSNLADSTSQVLNSTDDGASWQVSDARKPLTIAGALTAGKQCVFASTTTSGVLRLTDAAWIPIGGPPLARDTRSLCAIDDEIIIALDSNGNIVRTTNSGGVPIPGGYVPPSISSTSLFDTASPSPCSVAIETVTILPFSGTICQTPRIVSQIIGGPDSSAFRLMRISDSSLVQIDSDLVAFQPVGFARAYHALLTIALSDGTLWHIALNGHGLDSGSVRVDASNFATDTIGEITIPVRGSQIPRALDARLTYDTSSLIFIRATDAYGNEINRNATGGRADLHWNPTGGLAADTVLAYLQFQFYPTASLCATYIIDSLRFTSDSANCRTFTNAPSEICYSGSCAFPIYSSLMRTGSVPLLHITPNPAQASVLLSSDGSIGTATISLYDAAGVLRLTQSSDLTLSSPLLLDLSTLPSGFYLLRVQSGSFVATEKLLHMQ